MTIQASRRELRAVGRFLLPALVLLANCRTVFPEWSDDGPRKVETPQQAQADFDKCLRSMPILRGEPSRPYRVLRQIEGERESDLAWRACIEKADAVIADTPAGSATPARGVDRRSTTTPKVIGRAIKYDEQGSGADER